MRSKAVATLPRWVYVNNRSKFNPYQLYSADIERSTGFIQLVIVKTDFSRGKRICSGLEGVE